MHAFTAQLLSLDCNFISIDWSKCANNCCYFGARDCAIIVGSYLEELLQALVDNGAELDTFHLLGHSLGAHLMSQVSMNGLKVGRITGKGLMSDWNAWDESLSGFDPTRWGFDLEEPEHRLDPKDAKFVDVIHSSSSLGWNQPLGQSDFFPNSAGRQPGCSFLSGKLDRSFHNKLKQFTCSNMQPRNVLFVLYSEFIPWYKIPG